jgi:putative DNA primase/helicase
LQRAAGYSLTGDTREEVLPFVHGEGGSGKSTFGEALKSVLGDYAVTADFESFLRRRDTGIRNDLARLAGARLVLSLEVEDGRRLATALLKSLTGRDTISARFLNHEFFEFRPAFKLWLVANHRPTADASDEGLWRRVLLVPFTVALPPDERDPIVKQVLTEDPKARSAILAWAVRGALEWQARGLQVPDSVRLATKGYREECDDLAGFFEDCCVFNRDARTKSADLIASCGTWCAANNVTIPGTKILTAALSRRGCTQAKVGGARGWQGVGLLAT